MRTIDWNFIYNPSIGYDSKHLMRSLKIKMWRIRSWRPDSEEVIFWRGQHLKIRVWGSQPLNIRLWRSLLLMIITWASQSVRTKVTDRSLFISEHTLSREDLYFIFFIEYEGIQMVFPFVEKDFQTRFHLTWWFGETYQRLFWSFSKYSTILHPQWLFLFSI